MSGRALAEELGVSLRTLHRDVATLQAQGARIEGEPGLGYVLRPGFLLPPLMLSEAEVEALLLGARWVSSFADRPLAAAARDALAKVEAVLPPQVRDGAGAMPLRVGPPASAHLAAEDLSGLRDAIRRERKVQLRYQGGDGRESLRVIWPFAIGYFTTGRILVGWCEARGSYRHFRTDRVLEVRTLEEPTPRRWAEMLNEWLARQARHT